jgi:YbgC/YbaW family acyl-CoA thioester hydrolase
VFPICRGTRAPFFLSTFYFHLFSTSVPALPQHPHLTVLLEVYYFDTDAGGVVHNIAYLRMVEIARSQLAASLGWTLDDMSRTGLVPVVARTEIDYLRPARLGDALSVQAELVGLEKVRMYMQFEIRSAKSPELLFVRCTQTMVTVQLPGGRPQRIPEAWRTAYPHLAK